MAKQTVKSPANENAIALIEHPAEFGRLIGFTKLTDKLHEPWIMDMAFGDKDVHWRTLLFSYGTKTSFFCERQIMTLPK